MEGQSFWGTTNIKVASAVAAFGAKLRSVDPVTRIIKDGQQQVTFWFISSGDGDIARREMEVNWSEMKSDQESPIRYVRAALENRETLLGLVKRAEPIRIIQVGGQTLLVPENASPERKKALLRHI
ncbi:MAG: hypothetical protein EBR82_27220 [Caulobacteraceae bacterium]|nr:hypothetical protein [Caulobacteraceae bacterium]